MLVKVLMLAFENDGVVRTVDVPDEETSPTLQGVDPYWFENHVLERVFYYGQNDFQPQNICSVSVGDVVEHEGKYFMCAVTGWIEITPETLAEYKKLPRGYRSLAVIATGIVSPNEAIKEVQGRLGLEEAKKLAARSLPESIAAKLKSEPKTP